MSRGHQHLQHHACCHHVHAYSVSAGSKVATNILVACRGSQQKRQLFLQATGKFDLKEPYYRQLNPQTSAAWPQQEQASQQTGQEPLHQQQQQPYMQQMQSDSGQMQQAGNYHWSSQQQGMYPMMGHVPRDGSQPSEVSQWNQQGYQQQMWR